VGRDEIRGQASLGSCISPIWWLGILALVGVLDLPEM